ncbi:MAG: hypothetical protein LC104_15840 [Bacteroidales bacterium]|nr:hypothetical protein [Bacteroidales bacterium]
MKRTATAFLLVAGLGGCVSPDGGGKKTAVPPPNKFGAMTKSVSKSTATPASKATRSTNGVVPVSANEPASTPVTQAGFARVIGGGHGCASGDCGSAEGVSTPRLGGHFANKPPKMYPDYGPVANGFSIGTGHAGIFPAPAMGPYGAVAAVGAFGPGQSGPMYSDQRTQIRFANPAGMQITWLGPNGFTDDTPLEAPARYNFPQGNIYRLKLSGIPNRPGAVYYPTLEVYPATPATVTFLSHGPVPVSFTDEDFDQVRSGNLVTKVIYLPNPTYQDLAAVAGAEEVVSTRLEPGVDPIAEANRRGSILAVARIGSIDLQDPNTPAMTTPPAMGGPRPMGAPRPGAPLPIPSPAPGGAAPATPMPMQPSVGVPAMTVPNVMPGNPAVAMPAVLK